MLAIEQLLQPKTLQEALALREEFPQAAIVAGGSDVFIKLREKHPVQDVTLLSLTALDELRGVWQYPNGEICILPLTSFADLSRNEIIRANLPYLGEAVDQVGGPQVRNIGTIGGNICNGATSADSAAMLFALNATVHLQSTHGLRALPISEFYLGASKTDVRPGELLTAIYIKKEDYDGMGGHYIKYAMRQAMDIATLGVACVVKQQDSLIADVRLALGVASPTPMRCAQAEQAVLGKPLNAQTRALFAQTACREATPRTSWRASKEFRLHILYELAQRALQAAYNSTLEEVK